MRRTSGRLAFIRGGVSPLMKFPHEMIELRIPSVQGWIINDVQQGQVGQHTGNGG